MAINFDRRQTQTECEKMAREVQGLALNSEEFKFKGLIVENSYLPNLEQYCINDAVGAYYNALISFLNGCESLLAKNYSWAIVQLYYSIFYNIRCVLGFNKYVLIRKTRVYLLKLRLGEKTVELEKNDHDSAEKAFKKIYQASHFLYSNNIDGEDFFSWMKSLRNTVNYRVVNFKDPSVLSIMSKFISEIKQKNLADIIERYESDFNLYCFQEESAFLCGPYYLLLESASLYKSCGEVLTTTQKKHIVNLLEKTKLKRLEPKLF